MRYRSHLHDVRSGLNRLGLAVIATLAIVALMVAIISLTQTGREAIDQDSVSVQAPS